MSHVVGPIAASFGCVAYWEVTRGVRWLEVLLGVALVVAAWLAGFPPAATANALAAGGLLAALPFARATREECYGGGWTALLTAHRRG